MIELFFFVFHTDSSITNYRQQAKQQSWRRRCEAKAKLFRKFSPCNSYTQRPKSERATKFDLNNRHRRKAPEGAGQKDRTVAETDRKANKPDEGQIELAQKFAQEDRQQFRVRQRRRRPSTGSNRNQLKRGDYSKWLSSN